MRDGKVGECYLVTGLRMEGTLLRRLQALGLTPGTEVKVLNRKRSGSLIFSVRGTRLAVGKRIAQEIETKEVCGGGKGDE